MSEEARPDDPKSTSDSPMAEARRRLLQAAAAAATGLAVLPESWTKPVVGTILVPAHAAVSGPSPTPGVSMSATPVVPFSVTPTMTPTPSQVAPTAT